MTMFYVCANQLTSTVRGEDDMFNAPIAGALSGALYKSTAKNWMMLGRYSLGGCVFFTLVDQAFRNNVFSR